MDSRELNREEKTVIRTLVVKWCANYDREFGCLPLDCECYMLGKCWTGAYCRYFREAVLPLNPVLEVALNTEGLAAAAPLLPGWGVSFYVLPRFPRTVLTFREEVTMDKNQGYRLPPSFRMVRMCIFEPQSL